MALRAPSSTAEQAGIALPWEELLLQAASQRKASPAGRGANLPLEAEGLPTLPSFLHKANSGMA